MYSRLYGIFTYLTKIERVRLLRRLLHGISRLRVRAPPRAIFIFFFAFGKSYLWQQCAMQSHCCSHCAKRTTICSWSSGHRFLSARIMFNLNYTLRGEGRILVKTCPVSSSDQYTVDYRGSNQLTYHHRIYSSLNTPRKTSSSCKLDNGDSAKFMVRTVSMARLYMQCQSLHVRRW